MRNYFLTLNFLEEKLKKKERFSKEKIGLRGPMPPGILLKRHALEILNLEEKTLNELKGKEDVVEGTITIGCGEFAPEFAQYFSGRSETLEWCRTG